MSFHFERAKEYYTGMANIYLHYTKRGKCRIMILQCKSSYFCFNKEYEEANTEQENRTNSVLLTGLEFNCTVRDFLVRHT